MIYAVGDIHGQLMKLVQLLHRLDLEEPDRLVFLGDYVDRGPATQEVIESLIQLKDKNPNTVFLRGNHDQGMLDARDVFDRTRETDLTFMDIEWWVEYGGRETAESYGGLKEWWNHVPATHWQFLGETVLEYREGPYLFVHAGVLPPGQRWTLAGDPRMWIRDPFLRFEGDLGAVVVFGHSPQMSGFPLVTSNKVGIDTGAGYGGALTAVRLDPSRPFDPNELQFISAV